MRVGLMRVQLVVSDQYWDMMREEKEQIGSSWREGALDGAELELV